MQNMPPSMVSFFIQTGMVKTFKAQNITFYYDPKMTTIDEIQKIYEAGGIKSLQNLYHSL